MTSGDTMPIPSEAREDKLDICQTIDLSQTQSTQDVFGTGSDSEMPPMLTREDAGIYQKPFISPNQDAST